MFAIKLTYPSIDEEIEVVKSTTGDDSVILNTLFSAEGIREVQSLVRRIPIADNVIDYTVRLVNKTRPSSETAPDLVKDFVDWGAGPRASQNLILGAKAHAAVNGKFSPDIEDVKAVALGILRHRVLKNYKAEAEGISEEEIIKQLLE